MFSILIKVSILISFPNIKLPFHLVSPLRIHLEVSSIHLLKITKSFFQLKIHHFNIQIYEQMFIFEYLNVLFTIYLTIIGISILHDILQSTTLVK